MICNVCFDHFLQKTNNIMQRAINKFTSRKDTVSCEKKDKKLIRKRKFGSWLNICPHIPVCICKRCCFNNFVQSVKLSLTWLNNNNYYKWLLMYCWVQGYISSWLFVRFHQVYGSEGTDIDRRKKILNTSGKSNSPLRHHQLEGLDCH